MNDPNVVYRRKCPDSQRRLRLSGVARQSDVQPEYLKLNVECRTCKASLQRAFCRIRTTASVALFVLLATVMILVPFSAAWAEGEVTFQSAFEDAARGTGEARQVAWQVFAERPSEAAEFLLAKAKGTEEAVDMGATLFGRLTAESKPAREALVSRIADWESEHRATAIPDAYRRSFVGNVPTSELDTMLLDERLEKFHWHIIRRIHVSCLIAGRPKQESELGGFLDPWDTALSEYRAMKEKDHTSAAAILKAYMSSHVRGVRDSSNEQGVRARTYAMHLLKALEQASSEPQLSAVEPLHSLILAKGTDDELFNALWREYAVVSRSERAMPELEAKYHLASSRNGELVRAANELFEARSRLAVYYSSTELLRDFAVSEEVRNAAKVTPRNVRKMNDDQLLKLIRSLAGLPQDSDSEQPRSRLRNSTSILSDKVIEFRREWARSKGLTPEPAQAVLVENVLRELNDRANAQHQR